MDPAPEINLSHDNKYKLMCEAVLYVGGWLLIIFEEIVLRPMRITCDYCRLQ